MNFDLFFTNPSRFDFHENCDNILGGCTNLCDYYTCVEIVTYVAKTKLSILLSTPLYINISDFLSE